MQEVYLPHLAEVVRFQHFEEVFEAHVSLYQPGDHFDLDVAGRDAAVDAVLGVVALGHDVGEAVEAVAHEVSVREVQQLLAGRRAGE